ncbi:MAG: enoyl-CoA hydratase-related protein [Oceanococcus sp.]
MSFENLLISQADAVTTITLNRPDSLNALSEGLLLDLCKALQQAAADDACRCIVLTGAGRGFSSGADLKDTLSALKPGERPDLGAALHTTYHPVLREIRKAKKPVVAALNGIAAGAGLNIALACDVVVAARSAKFIQAFVRIGLIPDAGGTWTVPRLIGRARATQWLMSGESLSAEKAECWGLIGEVFDDEDFADKAQALAARMAAQPTRALAAMKLLMDTSLDKDLESQIALEASLQTEVGYSADAMEGIAAFVQKREANFKGR